MAQGGYIGVFAPGFESVERVVEHQNNLAALAGYTHLSNGNAIEEEIKKQEIGRLRVLYEALKTEEEKFLGKIKNVEELEVRLKEWEDSGVGSFFVNGLQNKEFRWLVQKILKDLTAAWFNQNYTDKINFLLNNSESFREATQQAVQDSPKMNELIPRIKRAFMNMAIQKGENSKQVNIMGLKYQYFKIFFNGQEIDLSKIKKDKNIIDPNTVITIEFSQDIPANSAKKIGKIITSFTGQQFKDLDLNEQVKQKVLESIMSYIGTGGPQSCIKEELEKYFLKFDILAINRNESVIKGFLGEIYWTAFWHFILGKNTVPIGNVKITEGVSIGESVPVDIILEDIGFQIKNYFILNSDKDTAMIKMPPGKPSSVQLDTYLSDRIELDAFVDPVEKFFFSYGYNRTLNTQDAIKKFQPVQSRFNAILNQFKLALYRYSTDRIDKLIGIDRNVDFDIDPDIYGEGFFEKTNLNTVYIIGNQLVFASDIVASMIRGLESSSGNSVDIILNVFDVSGLHQPDLGGVYPEPLPYDGKKAMKGQKISYQIQINLFNLAQEVISKVREIKGISI